MSTFCTPNLAEVDLKDRLDRWRMETGDLIDECEELERERDEARKLARHLLDLWCGSNDICGQGFVETYSWLKEA